VSLSERFAALVRKIDALFAAAEDANAVLLLDEADAIFGKRTEVKDAHDRYANLEVGYVPEPKR
jgi:ATP-dependent 26S proteasome regulatory subunit